jgi:DNA-binding NarL/FixJ family response regulator
MQTKKNQIKILLAISNNILCEGLRKIISEDSQKDALCSSNAGHYPSPDIIIFDVHQDLHTLQSTHPGAKVILLDTGLKDQEISCLLVCHQIRGIVSPDATIEMFHKAIRIVNRGDIWIDQKHLKALLQRNGSMNDNGDIKSLSEQDKKIVKLITQGYKNRDIGEKLYLSEHTIKAHISRIFRRLDVSNRTQLVCLAMEYDSEFNQLQ